MLTHTFKQITKKMMTERTYLILPMILVATVATAQSGLPVMTAGDKPISIFEDGGKKPAIKSWVVNPKLRPDVYETAARQVTYKSETDSLTFDIAKDGIYDFVVLKNGRDSAFQQIRWIPVSKVVSTRIEGEARRKSPLEYPVEDSLRISPTGRLSRKQALFDIDALIYTISEVHPNMFAVCGQDRFFSAVNRVKRSLPDSLTRPELFMAVAPLVAMIGDGHTCLNFPHWDEAFKSRRRLPVLFDIDTERYALKVSGCIDGAIPKGAEVLSINGTGSREMLERMMLYESGERYFFQLSRVNYVFACLFVMLYDADSYKIEYREQGSKKTKTVTLSAATSEEMKSRIPKEEVKQEELPDYSFHIIKEKGVAVMDFRQFSDRKRMHVFADSMFTAMRENGIKKLIIDIRYNGGGNSGVGDELLRYISPKPFTQFSKAFSRITPTTLRLRKRLASSTAGLYFSCDDERDYETPRTAEEGHFDGKVYLLISHNTFSSASSFSWVFKQLGMGTVVGEESGGMNVCFGDIVGYNMPVSGINCTISYRRFWQYGADEYDIHGTIPDIVVPEKEALEVALGIED